MMTDLIRGFTSSLLHLDASLVQCTGWLALICLLKAERDFEKRLDKLLAGFDIPDHSHVIYGIIVRVRMFIKKLDYERYKGQKYQAEILSACIQQMWHS